MCQKNKPQSCNTKGTGLPIEVLKEKKVIREESKTETPDHTKANEDKRFIQVETLIEKTEEVANIKEGCGPEGKVVQEETVTEEPTPTEVTVVKENCVAGEPALTEVKEDGEDPPSSISSLLDVANGELNPFARLKRSTVKSWTVIYFL